MGRGERGRGPARAGRERDAAPARVPQLGGLPAACRRHVQRRQLEQGVRDADVPVRGEDAGHAGGLRRGGRADAGAVRDVLRPRGEARGEAHRPGADGADDVPQPDPARTAARRPLPRPDGAQVGGAVHRLLRAPHEGQEGHRRVGERQRDALPRRELRRRHGGVVAAVHPFRHPPRGRHAPDHRRGRPRHHARQRMAHARERADVRLRGRASLPPHLRQGVPRRGERHPPGVLLRGAERAAGGRRRQAGAPTRARCSGGARSTRTTSTLRRTIGGRSTRNSG